MRVTAQYAEQHFLDLLTAAERGEEVEILRVGGALLRLVVSESVAPKAREERVLGLGRGELRVPSEQEWHAMDEEPARRMSEPALA